jgi:phosphonate transport system substrate-binding protein
MRTIIRAFSRRGSRSRSDFEHGFRRRWRSRIAGIQSPAICCLLACMVYLAVHEFPFATVTAAEESTARKNTLVIGKVSNNPRKHYRYLKPMVDYAVTHMKDLGIEKGEVLMARDDEQMIQFLRRGRVDWVTETAYSALLYEYHDAAEILLRKWKKDSDEYHTVFFTQKDSSIQSLSDLKGKVIALEHAGSTTAFFEPLLCLLNEGIHFQRLPSFKDRPAENRVGYVFSHQEINSSVWVHKGLVDAGAFNNQDWNKSDHMYRNMRNDMVIFHRSQPIPRAFELVSAGLDAEVRERLKSVLLNAHLDNKAQKALRAYQMTRQFDELDDRNLTRMKELHESLLQHMEAIR